MREIGGKLPMRYLWMAGIESTFDRGHNHQRSILARIQNSCQRSAVQLHGRPLRHVAPIAHHKRIHVRRHHSIQYPGARGGLTIPVQIIGVCRMSGVDRATGVAFPCKEINPFDRLAVECWRREKTTAFRVPSLSDAE